MTSSLRHGARRTATWSTVAPLLLVTTLAASSAEAGRVTVTIHRPDGGPPAAVTVVARSEETGATREATSPGTGPAVVGLTPGVWILSPASEQLWGEDRAIVVRDENETVDASLVVWPAAWLLGRVTTPRGVAPPSRLTLALQPGPDSHQGPSSARVDCGVTEGAWRCRVPAGVWDVDLAARGFTSRFFWDVSAAPGNETSLGNLQMTPGNEIVGRVVTATGEPLEKPCRVRLNTTGGEPLVSFSKPERASGKRSRSFEVRTGVRGHYQMTQVPPGDYEIAALMEGLAEAKATIGVQRAERTAVEPLVLESLATLEIDISPETSPEGDPWRLTLVRPFGPSSRMEALESAAVVPADGHFRRAALAAGIYFVIVASADGQEWLTAYTVLSPGSGTLSLRIPTLVLHGRIRLGEEPLAAGITFRDPSGAETTFSSDESGEFSGPIRAEVEKWEVRVRASGVERTLNGIRPVVTDGEATVELSLPATSLRGLVVGQNEKPVARCIVSYQGLDTIERLVEGMTDPGGRFSFEGLPSGSGLVSARCRRRSQEVQVSLVDGSEVDVRLTLQDAVTISGRVIGPDGNGVAGAQLDAHPIQSIPLFSAEIHDVTDTSGDFKLPVPSSTERLAIRVTAQGFALRYHLLRVTPDKPLVIVLDKETGTLALDFGGRTITGSREWGGANLYLVYHGFIDPVRALLFWGLNHRNSGNSWAEFGHIGRLTLPDMAAGRYALCAFGLREAMSYESNRSACVEGELAAGQTLNLTLPSVRER